MSNIILELRQKDTNRVNANGDYETFLGGDVVIEEGDMVQLKNAWVDTVREGTIVIPEDLTLTTNHCLYFTDFNSYLPSGTGSYTLDQLMKQNYVNQDNSTNVRQYNGGMYIPYTINQTGSSNLQVIEGFAYTTLDNTPYTKGGFNATYQYLNHLNQTITFHTWVPEFTADVGQYVDTFTVICQPNSLQLTNPDSDTLATLWVTIVGPQISGNLVDVIAEPMIFTNSFSLPAGYYSPNQLGVFISEAMTKNQLSGESFVSEQSAYLKYHQMFGAGQPYPNGAVDANGNPAIIPKISGTEIGTYWFKSDLSSRMNFNPNNENFIFNGETISPQYYIGTSQIQLAYDAESQKFSWQYLHFPMYDLNGENMSVRYIQYQVNGTPNGFKYTCANVGGIFFTGLTASVTATGKSYSFWDKVLGFDLASICPQRNLMVQGTNTQMIYGINGTVFGYTLNVGQHVTDGFVGIDSAIVKNLIYFLMQNDLNMASTINSTIPITASLSQDQLLDYYSHFVLECDFKFTTNFLGRDMMRKVQGTISKFQNYGSYTYGETDGAIQYIHRGAPIILRSVGVRILKSDKTLDDNLGDDNTIIFQVIKNPQAKLKKNN